MKQTEAFADVSCDNFGSPPASQSERHSSLFRLRRQSALFGDIGRHLSMLGELIEQELSSLPSPPGLCGSLGRNSPAHQSPTCLNGGRVAKVTTTFPIGSPHATPPPVELASVLRAAEDFASRQIVTHFGAIGAVVKPPRKHVFGPSSFPPPPPPVKENGSQHAPPSFEDAKDGPRDPQELSFSYDSEKKNISEDDEVNSSFEQLRNVANHENVPPPPYPPVELPCVPVDDGDEDSGGEELRESFAPCELMKERDSRNMSRYTISVVEYLRNGRCSEDHEESSTFHDYLRNKMAGRQSEVVLAAIVAANAILLGLQADDRIRGRESNLWYRVLDVMFTVFFLFELCLRIYLEGCSFFAMNQPNFTWNIADATIISISAFEELLYISSAAFAFVNISSLRVLRVLRVARLLRTVRLMRYFRDLRVMVSGIFASLKSLTGAVALLILLVYLTSVLIVDTLAEQATQSQSVMEWYGGVDVSLYTLFLSILGGIDWGDAAAPLFAASVPLGFAFLLYVTFSLMCVLNIVTGVFVENASQLTVKSDEEVIAERMLLQKRYISEARDIMIDMFPSEKITEGGFATLLGTIEFQAILLKLDVRVDQSMSESLFQAIDFDGEGCIDASELSCRIGKFHGQAKSLDVLHLINCFKKLNARMDALVSGESSRHVSCNRLGSESGHVSPSDFDPKSYHRRSNSGSNPSCPFEAKQPGFPAPGVIGTFHEDR